MSTTEKTLNLSLLSLELEKLTPKSCDEARRLFHGRGHCYPGLECLNIDWFAPVVWVVIYGEVEQNQIDALVLLLEAFAKKHEAIEALSLQRRVRGKAQQDIIYGNVPEQCFAYEAGSKYLLNLSANQNIGFFLDAAPARKWLADNSDGKRVLNLFAYTCSFSLAALQGGAESVVNIDMAKAALATGQKNHQHNQLDMRQVRFLPHDIFRSTRKLVNLGPYDVVIIDPPSRQKGSFEADKDYGKLLRKLQPMLADEALILACLNAPYLSDDFLLNSFADNLPQAEFQQRIAQRDDFPEHDLQCCLKMQLFKMGPA